ncbi:Pyridoxamine 5'-phosphate oxidase [Roseomonas rosea]|uniref:Pyridoxamine 5'-phosphate oxidase n=1 Tax=Muricoccus roseus TaxID=198092 RepID=A0A1M6MTQ0_9PROT|nr:pyridoxamine 5'-phosphate oxidase family protein [Roseomonas rosea]SHJ86633.1 Pyridoxamine 5'-phosphate oxidase [Roseomonas rosea]
MTEPEGGERPAPELEAELEAEPGAAAEQDEVVAAAEARRAGLAREARGLMRAAASAMLATLGKDGHPHAALVTPAIAPDGAVLLWLSTLSEHTRQLARDGRCSLLFQGPPAEENPQTTPRVSVSGTAERVEDEALKAVWLARHPYAEAYAGFADFSLWRIVPRAALMVLGFGRAHRLRGVDLVPPPGEAGA